MIDRKRASSLLCYEASTGEFRWRVSRGNLRSGAIAGTLDSYGYVQIKIDGVLILAHRLAWLLTVGDPPPFLDHINGDRSDNRFANLRPATRRQNAGNRKPNRGTKTGLKGVRKVAGCSTFRAVIGGSKDRQHLGTFPTAEEAHAAYVAAARARYGEFARIGENKLLPPPQDARS